MKKISIQTVLFLLFLGCALSGCVTLHQSAVASFDETSVHFNGTSFIRVKGEDAGYNAGYLMNEGFLTGGGDAPSDIGLNMGSSTSFLASNSRDLSWVVDDPLIKKRHVQAQQKGFFSLSEEIEFIKKGYTEDDGAGTTKNSFYYLEVPVLVNYNYKLKNGHQLYGGLGAYAAAGLFGHYKGTYSGQDNSGSIKFGPNADYNRMDYGLVAKVGYDFSKKFGAFLNYDFGLRNIYSPDDKLFNRSFGINVTYKIK